MAASRYAGPSTCIAGVSGVGSGPSWKEDRLPPGKTCAEANDDDVCTLWRSSTSLVGESRRMLACVSY